MTPRSVSPVALDDRRMRRLFLARLHEDSGGSHELSLYGQALYEAATESGSQVSTCSRCSREKRNTEQRDREDMVREDGRVPFPKFADFSELTRRAVTIAEEIEGPFDEPLRLLYDCYPILGFEREQERGATFKQLAAIGHAFEMTGAQRGRWYKIAESVPLAQRHAGHILSKLKRGTP